MHFCGKSPELVLKRYPGLYYKTVWIAVFAFIHISAAQSQLQTIYLQDGKFFLPDSTSFVPIVTNYGAWIKDEYIPGNCHIGPLDWVYPAGALTCQNQTECSKEIRRHFAEIRAKGFNTIRSGVAVQASSNFNRLVVGEPQRPFGEFYCQDSIEHLFTYIDTLLTLADLEGLKVILLTGHRGVDHPDLTIPYADFLTGLSKRFENDPRIFAYDLYNEPDYQQTYRHTKREAFEKVRFWRERIRFETTNLVTIGLSPFDIWSWDFAMMDVDFISFHTYPSFPIETKWEMEFAEYWQEFFRSLQYASFVCRKTWIIGETGVSVSIDPKETGDHGSLSQQKEFGQRSLAATRDCNGLGYSWWTFTDEIYGFDERRWYGLRDRNNNWKPVSEIFLNASESWNQIAPGNCEPDNYFYSGPAKLLKASGVITDWEGNPIGGALVLPVFHGTGTSKKHMAISDSSGYFEIRANFFHVVEKLKVTAPGCQSCLNIQPGIHGYTEIQLPCFNMENTNLQLQTFEGQSCMISGEEFGFRIYPNPAADVLIIRVQSSIDANCNIQIFNTEGKTIKDYSIESDMTKTLGEEFLLDLAGIPPGMYFARASLASRQQTKKFLVIPVIQ